MAIPFPNIDPVLISVGPLSIRWYSLAYIVGLAFAWWHMARLSTKNEGVISKDGIDDLISWGALGIILGGRLGYVLFYNLDFFMAHPKEIIAIWKGGMSFHGGLIGVIATVILYARVKKLNTLAISDFISSAAPIGLFFGRIANFINSELYGRITETTPWAIVFPTGGPFPRHPSQIYEALLEGALLFIILQILYNRKWFKQRAGAITGAFFIGYGSFRMFIELFREPDAQIGFIFNYITMGQILCLPMIAIGAALLFIANKNKDNHQKSEKPTNKPATPHAKTEEKANADSK
ncbi:MAG: prolipoprotein diacylglyceryl transferase [Alphaproteobacteria bacterium]|nr:prolipoprotein diacylglyceryl transferase [Alphaproteobacteria bacterium]